MRVGRGEPDLAALGHVDFLQASDSGHGAFDFQGGSVDVVGARGAGARLPAVARCHVRQQQRHSRSAGRRHRRRGRVQHQQSSRLHRQQRVIGHGQPERHHLHDPRLGHRQRGCGHLHLHQPDPDAPALAEGPARRAPERGRPVRADHRRGRGARHRHHHRQHHRAHRRGPAGGRHAGDRLHAVRGGLGRGQSGVLRQYLQLHQRPGRRAT